MNKSFEIDISKRNRETSIFDLISIKLKDNEPFLVHYSKLIGQSKYFHDNYKYSESVSMIQTDINQVKEKFSIKNQSIENFFKLIEHEKTNIQLDQFRDIYLLSIHFGIDNITHELVNVIQETFYNDINDAIEFLITSQRDEHEEISELTNQIENFLSTQLRECFENERFEELPIAIICRLLEKSHYKDINQNKLLDFILKSVEKRYIMFLYIKPHHEHRQTK